MRVVTCGRTYAAMLGQKKQTIKTRKRVDFTTLKKGPRRFSKRSKDLRTLLDICSWYDKWQFSAALC